MVFRRDVTGCYILPIKPTSTNSAVHSGSSKDLAARRLQRDQTHSLDYHFGLFSELCQENRERITIWLNDV
jgi:hypothetical protein